MDTSSVAAQDVSTTITLLQVLGAICFGAIVGWYVYYINRYRQGGVEFSDLVTVIGIIGGGAVLALFEPETDLFGAYGIGLALGFFGYFLVLLTLVRITPHFNVDWFLDGRRMRPKEPYFIPEGSRGTSSAMGNNQSSPGSGAATQHQSGGADRPPRPPQETE